MSDAKVRVDPFQRIIDAALSGDSSHARGLLKSIATRCKQAPIDGGLYGQGGLWLNADDCAFLAVALDRIAENGRAVSVVSQAPKHKGRKEKTGRPPETRKGLNVALYMAMHMRDTGGTVEEAVAAVRKASFSPKGRSRILSYWSAYRHEAESILDNSQSKDVGTLGD